MSIKEIWEKVKSQEFNIFLVLLLFLVALISFLLGRLAYLEDVRCPVVIEDALSEEI